MSDPEDVGGVDWTCDIPLTCLHIQYESMEKIMKNMLTENMASSGYHCDGRIRYDPDYCTLNSPLL